MTRVVANLLKLFCDPASLVLVINASTHEQVIVNVF